MTDKIKSNGEPDTFKGRAPENWWNDERHWRFRRGDENLKAIWEEHQDEFLAADPEMQKDFTDKFTKSVGYAPMEGPPEDDQDKGGNPELSEDEKEAAYQAEVDQKLTEIRGFGGDITSEGKAALGMGVMPTKLDGLQALRDKCHEIYLKKNQM